MSENKDLGQSEPRGVSRRTVTKAMAWSVPVVAVAAAAPIAAASPPPPCLTYDFTGAACKWPGSGNFWAYNLQFEICNNCPNDVTIHFDHLQNNAAKVLVGCDGSIAGTSVMIKSGECWTSPLYSYQSTSSAAKVQIWGTIGGSTVVEMLAELEAGPKIGECSGTNPCVPA